MSSTDRNTDPRDAHPDRCHPSIRVYTPRLEEFEEAVADMVKRYHELPDWLKTSMQGRLQAK